MPRPSVGQQAPADSGARRAHCAALAESLELVEDAITGKKLKIREQLLYIDLTMTSGNRLQLRNCDRRRRHRRKRRRRRRQGRLHRCLWPS